jgi:tetratricopeptide (TPR) repeat protein
MSLVARAAVALVASAAAAAIAQAQSYRSQVAASQPGKYEPPGCGIKAGHFLVSGAATKLSVAVGSDNPGNRERLLREGQEVLVEAITTKGQAKNPAAWYFLGRIALYRGDPLEADTAFARAESLAPQCAEEIRGFRRTAWGALIGAGGVYSADNRPDSALLAYHLAAGLLPKEPEPWYWIGATHEGSEQTDSAIAAYNRAAGLAPGSQEKGEKYERLALSRLGALLLRSERVDSGVVVYEKLIAILGQSGDTAARNLAALTVARSLYQAQRYAQAIPAFRRYLGWRPGDPTARQYLAGAFQALGQPDSAQAALGERGLAATGRSAPDSESAAVFINRGVSKYQAKDFQGAAAEFRQALEREPYHRVALTNLAYTYNELKDGVRLVEVANRLLDKEPYNETALRFAVQGYVLLQDRAKGLEAVKRLDAAPIAVDSLRLEPRPGGLKLSGSFRGRSAAPEAFTLVFEFLNASGAVIATAEQPVPSLFPEVRQPFTIGVPGTAVVDWRYRRR